MATHAQLLADIAAAVVTQTGATRLGSDYRDDLEAIPDGATRFQLRGGPSGQDTDSNISYAVASVQLRVHHRLSGTERAYTEAAMQTDLAAMIDPEFWRGLASAFEVLEDPVYSVERVGRVITYTIETSIAIVP